MWDNKVCRINTNYPKLSSNSPSYLELFIVYILCKSCYLVQLIVKLNYVISDYMIGAHSYHDKGETG